MPHPLQQGAPSISSVFPRHIWSQLCLFQSPSFPDIFCPLPVDLGSSPKFSCLAGSLVPRWIWPTSPCGVSRLLPGFRTVVVSVYYEKYPGYMKPSLPHSGPCSEMPENSKLPLFWPIIFQYNCYLFNQGCTKVFLVLPFPNILDLPLR